MNTNAAKTTNLPFAYVDAEAFEKQRERPVANTERMFQFVIHDSETYYRFELSWDVDDPSNPSWDTRRFMDGAWYQDPMGHVSRGASA